MKIFNRERLFCLFFWGFIFKCMWGTTNDLQLDNDAHYSRLKSAVNEIIKQLESI